MWRAREQSCCTVTWGTHTVHCAPCTEHHTPHTTGTNLPRHLQSQSQSQNTSPKLWLPRWNCCNVIIIHPEPQPSPHPQFHSHSHTHAQSHLQPHPHTRPSSSALKMSNDYGSKWTTTTQTSGDHTERKSPVQNNV